MKRFIPYLLVTLLIVLFTGGAAAQTTAFTYQGRLTEGSNAANGLYDFKFRLFNDASQVVATAPTFEDVAVTNGRFTVSLDFGAGPFDGRPLWLEVCIRAGESTGLYTTVLPLQFLSPAPSALFARRAATLINGSIQDPTFLGTTGLTPLDLFVNNTRAFRL